MKTDFFTFEENISHSCNYFSGSEIQSRQANLSKNTKLKDHPQYYGKPIAKFKTNAHDVSGMVYAATDDTFYITDFNYDGQGPGKLA